jgi:SAM-dependent methyltransferase
VAAPDNAGNWEQEGMYDDALPDGWRRHGRAAHLDLVHRWVGDLEGRWLKTDLQEERSPRRSLLDSLDGDWVGIDLSSQVARAAAGAGVVGAAADVRALPFATGSLDGVLSTSTLDHFHDPADIDRSLVELHRVLAPGGHLVLTLDNARHPLIRARNAMPPRWRRRTGLAPFHVGPTLSLEGGIRALERAGFDVVASDHLLHAPHVVGTRAARWRWWERTALPALDRLGSTRAARYTGHFVAFHARAGGRA